MKEKLNRRDFLIGSAKQLGVLIGVGLGIKALKDVKDQEESLAETDRIADLNTNLISRKLFEHEVRLRQLEGKPIQPQKAEEERKI